MGLLHFVALTFMVEKLDSVVRLIFRTPKQLHLLLGKASILEIAAQQVLFGVPLPFWGDMSVPRYKGNGDSK